MLGFKAERTQIYTLFGTWIGAMDAISLPGGGQFRKAVVLRFVEYVINPTYSEARMGVVLSAFELILEAYPQYQSIPPQRPLDRVSLTAPL